MRFLSGVIVGVLLTVGAAYLTDTMAGTPGPDGKARRMVNWDIVSDELGGLSSTVQGLWGRLVGEAKSLDKSVK